MSNTTKIRLKTLSPIHVGSGVELNGNFEYLFFQNEGVIAVIDTDKVLEIIGVDNIGQWTSLIENDGNLLSFLQKRSSSLYPEDVAERIMTIVNNAPNPSKNKIKEQLCLGKDKVPIIPGSSLKGSIRTALLTKLIKDNPEFVKKDHNLKSKRGRYSDKSLQGYYLGKTANEDLLKLLRVSDFSFNTNTCVVRNNIINQYRQGWGEKRNQSSFFECIPENTQTESTIQIPENLIKRIAEKQFISKNLNLIDLPRLFKIVNRHSLELVSNELDFWDEEQNPIVIGDYMEKLEKVETELKNIDEKSCILRVGAGGGWDSMTGGWPAGVDVYGEDILSDRTWVNLKRVLRRKRYPDDMMFPKTRKMLEGGVPLGFVKLTIV